MCLLLEWEIDAAVDDEAVFVEEEVDGVLTEDDVFEDEEETVAVDGPEPVLAAPEECTADDSDADEELVGGQTAAAWPSAFSVQGLRPLMLPVGQ